MVATTVDPADPVIIHTSKARGAELTSSYEEEKAALPLALDWPATRQQGRPHHPHLGFRSQGYTRLRRRWRIGESSCHRHRHATPTHLICHRQSLHPTHRQRSPVQQAPNSHGVRTFLLEGRLHHHLQQGRCRSPSPTEIGTHTASQGVRPLARYGSPLFKEESRTLDHWLQRCPNFDAFWQHTFGSPSPSLYISTTDPEKVLALARATF